MMLPVERNNAKTQHLGNLRNLVAATDKENYINDKKVARFRLLESAKRLLPGWGVDYCMEATIPGESVTIWQDTESGAAHVKGVARCGSVWTCPVCSTQIALQRKQEISTALKAAEKIGYRPVLVTLTASHGRDMSAAELIKQLTNAKRDMRRARAFRELKNEIGYRGSISSLECTWGYANGFHFHFHEVFLVSKVLQPETVKNMFFTRWERALSRVGLTCDYEHGVDVIIPKQDDYELVGNYIAKWGLESELSRGDAKEGRSDHFSPFQLLAMSEAKPWAGGVFVEYAKATKGQTSMRWSRGLRDVLGLSKELTDKEAAEARLSENSVLLARLTVKQWKRVIYSGRSGVVGELLAVARSGRDALLLWLESVFDIMPDG